MCNNSKDFFKGFTIKKAISLTAIFLMFFSVASNAQCAMCRAALTSEGNKTKAEAVNDGIVYLMAIPYLLAGGIGYAIYRMKKK
jgi:hypothetical protein